MDLPAVRHRGGQRRADRRRRPRPPGPDPGGSAERPRHRPRSTSATAPPLPGGDGLPEGSGPVGEPTSANRGAARAAVSASGSGSATRPASSKHQNQVEQPEPQPAVGSPGRRARPHPSPPGWSTGRSGPPATAKAARRSLGRALLGQHLVDGVAEFALLGGEGEVHVGPDVPQPRGRPSMRSATTLRWISLVPA